MTHYHAAVWLDHREARIFGIGRDEVERFAVLAHPHHRQVHHRHGALGSGRTPEDTKFFAEIAEHLKGPEEILVAGPGKAKLELLRYLHTHAPAVEAKVMAVESADHPTDGQFVAHARAAFAALDRIAKQP
jgi:stalled ribosome rescue protein Dom34